MSIGCLTSSYLRQMGGLAQIYAPKTKNPAGAYGLADWAFREAEAKEREEERQRAEAARQEEVRRQALYNSNQTQQVISAQETKLQIFITASLNNFEDQNIFKSGQELIIMGNFVTLLQKEATL